MRFRDNAGQLLLEVLIALTILGLVAVAVVNVSTRSLKSARVTGDRKEALDYAKGVMIDIERERDEDTAAFFSGGDVVNEVCGTFGDNSEYSCGADYIFSSPPDSSSVKVKVSISWDEGDGTSSVDLDRIFTKARL